MAEPVHSTSVPQAPISPATDAYADLVTALHSCAHILARAAPPAIESTAIADTVRKLSSRLSEFEAEFSERPYGRRNDLPGRAQFLVPYYDRSHLCPNGGAVPIMLGDMFEGSHGAVHGGAISLVFDDVMGFVANIGRPLARTAYLNVHYRAVTRTNDPLTLECSVDSSVGRKLFLRGRLHDADGVTAEAEGLFVLSRDRTRAR